MKSTKGSIKVELEVLYYEYETRPQACHEHCPQLTHGTCTVFGKLTLQKLPGRWRYERAHACLEAESK